MAKSEEKKDKKKSAGFHFEAAAQDGVRDLLTKGIEVGGRYVEERDPDLLRAAAWVYTHKDGEKIRNWARGTILTGATLVENVADRIPFLPEWSREVIESVGGDLNSNLKSYFDRRVDRKEITFPDGYKVEWKDIRVIVRRFAGKFLEGFRSWLPTSGLAELLKKLDLDRLLGDGGYNHIDECIIAAKGLDSKERRKLARLWKSWSRTRREAFIHSAKHYRTTEELSRWIKMTPLEHRLFEQMNEMNKSRLLTNTERAFRRWRRDVERFGVQTLAGLNQGVEDASTTLRDSNVDRRTDLDDDWASPVNLNLHPERRYGLPPGHPEHRNRPQPGIIRRFGLLALMGLVTLIVVVAGATRGCRNEAPEVVIDSIEQGDTITTAKFKISGHVSDDERVGSVVVSLNNEAPRKPFIMPGRFVTWNLEYKDLRREANTLHVEARDRQGKRSTMDLDFRYIPKVVVQPLPGDSTTNGLNQSQLDSLMAVVRQNTKTTETYVQVNDHVRTLVMYNPREPERWQHDVMRAIVEGLHVGLNTLQLTAHDPNTNEEKLMMSMSMNVSAIELQFAQLGLAQRNIPRPPMEVK